jgi:anti-sigma B factor antagonist
VNFNVENVDDVVVVVLPGETLEASNSEEFKRDITSLLEDNTKVLFDMSQMQFVDSSGFGALLSCLRRLKAKEGDLKVFGLAKPVGALFRMIRMDRILDIFDTRDEAIKAFQG